MGSYDYSSHENLLPLPATKVQRGDQYGFGETIPHVQGAQAISMMVDLEAPLHLKDKFPAYREILNLS